MVIQIHFTRQVGANLGPLTSCIDKILARKATDGRFLTFAPSRDGKKPHLYVMDADGSAPHKVADIPGGSYTPNWSN